MEARSQQCIICLSNKEHTLVPPHLLYCTSSEDGPPLKPEQVAAHRFCTDCWADFLHHQLAENTGAGASLLNCPVCRVPIDVPDLWRVSFEIAPARQCCPQLQEASL